MGNLIQQIEDSIEREYRMLLRSGMFWEWYPELTGDWEKDKAAFIRLKTGPIPEKQWERKPCSITAAVIADLQASEAKGYKEYGVTLDRTDLSLRDWLEHAYSECIDKAKYLKKAIQMLDDEAANG